MQTEDLSTFFDPDELGDTATLSGGGSVNGVFVREFVVVNGVEGYYPTFTCASGSIAKSATLTINGTSFKAISVRPDGTGVDLIILEEQ